MGANYKPFAVQAGKRFGYGQVEPNHLSAQRTKQIYAQLPANSDITTLENGQFVKYDYAAGEVNYSGEGEWMLVFNEIKHYDEREKMAKDFAQGVSNGQLVPRVFKTNVGDIYTTNTLNEASVDNYTYTTIDTEKTYYVPDSTTGYLKGTNSKPASGMCWKRVTKEVVGSKDTLPDGQPAVKIQRIQ